MCFLNRFNYHRDYYNVKIFFFEYTERTVECELFDRVCVNYFRFTGGLCFFFFLFTRFMKILIQAC